MGRIVYYYDLWPMIRIFRFIQHLPDKDSVPKFQKCSEAFE